MSALFTNNLQRRWAPSVQRVRLYLLFGRDRQLLLCTRRAPSALSSTHLEWISLSAVSSRAPVRSNPMATGTFPREGVTLIVGTCGCDCQAPALF
jgi:hypothetical protein